jgi:hypothetical protein
VACLAAAVTPAAAAKPRHRPRPAPKGSPLGYAISAVGFRSYFMYTSHAGSTDRGTLLITNTGRRARTLRVAAVDVTTAANGGLQYGDGRPVRDGRWLKLSRRKVRVAAGHSVRDPFRMRVPAHLRAGQYFVGIAVQAAHLPTTHAVKRHALTLRLIPRLATTVAVRVPGHLTRSLAVHRAAVAVTPSGASLALGLADRGNALIDQTTGTVTVTRAGRRLLHKRVELGAFVPATAITYALPWPGIPHQGTYVVTGRLTPAHARPVVFRRTFTFGTKKLHQYRQETGKPTADSGKSGTPPTTPLLLGGAGALVALFAGAWMRTRARLHRLT